MYKVPQAAHEAALPPTASLDAHGSHRALPLIDTYDLPIIDSLHVCVCVRVCERESEKENVCREREYVCEQP